MMTQTCPACGATVETTNVEPLAQMACPKCGEEIPVERTFDHFVVVEALGVGGMGTVYKARDTLLDRFVALKLLRRDLSTEADHTAQLQQEARIAASVNHPNVIQVFSSGTDHGQFYLVMELVDHGSLDNLIEQRTSLPEMLVLETGIQVAKGLRAAYRQGLIHGDVKPANILFVDEHTAKISDFGLAGAAARGSDAEGVIWGTPYYVAPERLNNAPEDFRSDIYGLGATLFHAISGKAAIEGNTNSAAVLLELKQQPLSLRSVAPKVSEATAAVFQRMIAPDPAQRFSSYDELIAELEQAQGVPGSTHDGSMAHGRTRWLFLTGALLIAVIVGAAIFFVIRKPHENAPTKTLAKSSAQTARETTKGQSPARGAVNETPAQEEAKKTHDLEAGSWKAAFANYQEQIALYHFAEAAEAIKSVRLSDASLKRAKETAEKKAQWLIDWKDDLLKDLNDAHFSGVLADRSGAQYVGIASATDDSLSLKLRYGIARVKWTDFSPEVLLKVSTSFIQPAAEDAADRQWRCAVFASESGQTDAARQLAESAATGKPQFRDQISQLFPDVSQRR
jgi:tRNA A-37 threonylcarbamoyl transferase component Bud32